VKLFLLRPRDNHPLDGLPDNPWKNDGTLCVGMVIRAETYAQAREAASEAAGAENAGGADVWSKEEMTTCTEITQEGPLEIIMAEDLAEEAHR
jgi:hypothetical protein